MMRGELLDEDAELLASATELYDAMQPLYRYLRALVIIAKTSPDDEIVLRGQSAEGLEISLSVGDLRRASKALRKAEEL